mmetsp:Transcript_10236/g.23385  ORF Transcript_10236/g.23385 Transcript_10236/m.23385 type:complete len:223 (-) Transcript_10236:463-1131(-)
MTQLSKLQPSAYPLPLTSCRCGLSGLCTCGCHAGSVLAKLDLSSRQRGGPQRTRAVGIGWEGGAPAGVHTIKIACSPARRRGGQPAPQPRHAPHTCARCMAYLCPHVLLSRILLFGSIHPPKWLQKHLKKTQGWPDHGECRDLYVDLSSESVVRSPHGPDAVCTVTATRGGVVRAHLPKEEARQITRSGAFVRGQSRYTAVFAPIQRSVWPPRAGHGGSERL